MTAFDRPGWSTAIDRVTQNTPAVPPRTAGATGEAGSTPVPGLPTTPKWPLTIDASHARDGRIDVEPSGSRYHVWVQITTPDDRYTSIRLIAPEIDQLVGNLQAARAEIAARHEWFDHVHHSYAECTQHAVCCVGCHLDDESQRSARAAAEAAGIADSDSPNVCEHGYRFENALCPAPDCGAGPADGPASLLKWLDENDGEALVSVPQGDYIESPETRQGLDAWCEEEEKIAAEKRDQLNQEDQGTAALAVPVVVGVGGGLLLLAGAAGHHLPISTRPNGFALLVLAALAAVLWVTFRRRPTVPAEYELADWDGGELSDEDVAELVEEDEFLYAHGIDPYEPNGPRS